MLFIIMTACIAAFLAVPVVGRFVLALDYLRDGFSFETAWRVIPNREWSNVYSENLFAHFASLSMLLPGTPLLALCPQKRRALIAFACVVAIALAFSGWSFA